MPDIKLDLSRVTYSTVLEIVVAPVVPGGVLATGTLFLNPRLAGILLSSPFLGYRSRIVIAVFICYTAGLMLNLVVSYTGALVGYLVGHIFREAFAKHMPTPWKTLQWRKVARNFLGSTFAPETDDLYFPALHSQLIDEANRQTDPEFKSRQLAFAEQFHGPKQRSDGDWQMWYWILAKYFALTRWWAAPWQYYMSLIHTVSWAVILLMVLNRRYHWLAWVFCLFGIVIGTLAGWFSGGVYADPFAVEQTAMLLRATRLEIKADSVAEGS